MTLGSAQGAPTLVVADDPPTGRVVPTHREHAGPGRRAGRGCPGRVPAEGTTDVTAGWAGWGALVSSSAAGAG